MDLHAEIQKLDRYWHKLMFVCGNMDSDEVFQDLQEDIEILNINLIVSQGLMNIGRNKYPLYIEELIQTAMDNPNKIYGFTHIDILFDPVLQTNPVRLLENISKSRKLIILWPGEYKDGKLFYAESDHSEYFVCDDFQGNVIAL